MDKAKKYILNELLRLATAYSMAEKPAKEYLNLLATKFHDDNWKGVELHWTVDALLTDKEYAENAKFGRYPSYADFVRLRCGPQEGSIPNPTTNIAFIQDCFLDVCRFIHREGIMWVEYCAKVEKIPYGNKMFVKKIKKPDGTYKDVLMNKEWILDDLINDKEQSFPDFYFKFPGMRKIEKYALAHKLGVFAIKK